MDLLLYIMDLLLYIMNLLTVTESEIILGMTIDDLLLFDKHIYTAVKKGYNFSNMI